MIKRFLVSLRHKPKHVRENFAFGLATSVTGVIVMVWLYHLPSNVAERTARSTDEPGALKQFMDNARNQVGAARESAVADMPEAAPISLENFVQATVDAAAATSTRVVTPPAPIRLATTSPATTTNVE